MVKSEKSEKVKDEIKELIDKLQHEEYLTRLRKLIKAEIIFEEKSNTFL